MRIRHASSGVLLAVTTSLAGAGCYRSYFAGRAADYADDGKTGRAIANYAHALRVNDFGDYGEASDIEKKLSAVGSVAVASGTGDAGKGGKDPAVVIADLGLILDRAKEWKIPEADVAKVVAAIEKATDDLWPSIEAKLVPGGFDRALRTALSHVAGLPGESPSVRRVEEAKAKAAAHHLALAAERRDRAGSALLHHRLAQRYGDESAAGEREEAKRRLDDESGLRWVARGDGCGGDASTVARRLGEEPGRPVEVSITFSSCAPDSRSWLVQTTALAQRTEEYVETESYQTCTPVPQTCGTPYKVPISISGGTMTYYEAVNCSGGGQTCTTHTRDVVKTRVVTYEVPRTIQNRAFSYGVSGQALVRWDGKDRRVDMGGKVELTDHAYDDEAGQKSFDRSINAEAAKEAVLKTLLDRLEAAGDDIRRERAAEEIRLAKAASDHVEAEHHWTVASHMVSAVSAEGTRWISDRHGVDPELVAPTLFKGEAVSEPALRADARLYDTPDLDLEVERQSLWRVEDDEDPGVAEVQNWQSLDLAYVLAETPFEGIEPASGLRAELRMPMDEPDEAEGTVSIFAGADGPALGGGQAPGVVAGIVGSKTVFFGWKGRRTAPDLVLHIGGSWAWSGPREQMGYTNLAVVTGLSVPFFGFLSLDLRADWNFLGFWDWMEELANEGIINEADKYPPPDHHHWTPITAGVTAVLGETLFAKGGVTSWIGEPEGWRWFASLGMRL